MALPAAPHSTPGKSAGMTESESKDQPISPSPQVSAASPTGLLKSGTWFPVQTLQTSLFLLSPGRGWGCPFSGDTVLLSCSKTPHHGLNKVPSVLYTMRPILELGIHMLSNNLSRSPGRERDCCSILQMKRLRFREAESLLDVGFKSGNF